MPGANSVTSNQETLHKDLEEVVRKYARTTFLRPIADHTREGVTNAIRDGAPGANAETAPRAVILDSGCGTGESTIHIARRYPNIPVIGIDKSGMRLTKAGNPAQTAGEDVPPNAFWIRAELLDFWRLALDRVKTSKWTIPYHAVYYPNPWPKQSEATRRFHMHPIFPTLLALGNTIELRTNWEIYAREFAEAARIVIEERTSIASKELYGSPSSLRSVEDDRKNSHSAEVDKKGGSRLLGLRSTQALAGTTIKCESFDPSTPETAFERKYKDARQALWRVVIC